jgi:hypothetical protein
MNGEEEKRNKTDQRILVCILARNREGWCSGMAVRRLVGTCGELGLRGRSPEGVRRRREEKRREEEIKGWQTRRQEKPLTALIPSIRSL